MRHQTRPHVVILAGLDPSGGAGLVRDAITARALGASFYLVPTALTEQPPGRSTMVTVDARPPALVADGLRHALATAPPNSAVKIGMIANADTARAVATVLQQQHKGPVVLDPVLATTSGGRLWLGPTPPDQGLSPLWAHAHLITPNRDEAEVLSGQPVADPPAAIAAGERLRKRGAHAVLIKGGHLQEQTDQVVDLLLDDDGVVSLGGPRLPGRSPRGTGCALATAIAVHLAGGQDLRTACQNARAWLAEQITAATAVGGERHLPG